MREDQNRDCLEEYKKMINRKINKAHYQENENEISYTSDNRPHKKESITVKKKSTTNAANYTLEKGL